jgi:glycosyltransferase involved in cell wall biosynthesis
MHQCFTLTLCICTRNRPHDLRRCLDSISQSATRPAQLIISDDGDEGQSVENIVQEFDFAIYQRGPRKGLGANRNSCLASATSSHVLFIDDDVVLPADFVELAAAIYHKHSERVPLPIISGIEFKHVGEQVIRVEPHNPDFWGFQRVPPNHLLGALVINATIFPSQLFQEAMFDSRLRYGSEEVDMARHALSLGYQILLEPSLFVHHYPSEVNRDEYKTLVDASRLYATAKAYWLYQRKPIKTLLYILLAPPKELFAKARRSGMPGVISALRSMVTAYGYAMSARRERRP